MTAVIGVVQWLHVRLQPRADGAFREQALARPDHEREDPQTILVDEVVAHERLDQVPAAMHLQQPDRDL
jgi:hypothetical protein